jgi:two-component system CheB/CheR fusion protein
VQASGEAVEVRDVEWSRPARPLAAVGHPDRAAHRRRRAAGRPPRLRGRLGPHELRARLGQLDSELTTAYEELQSSSEELETTNEELQSAVEELETTNEELQSTNEELETMNEELQSTNEELQTLNDELRDRRSRSTGQRLPAGHPRRGSSSPCVVVDTDFRVQLWNGGAERLTGLRRSRRGPPLLRARAWTCRRALRRRCGRGRRRATSRPGRRRD